MGKFICICTGMKQVEKVQTFLKSLKFKDESKLHQGDKDLNESLKNFGRF